MILHGGEVIVVSIEAAAIHLYEAHTGFHQTPREQRPTAKGCVTITRHGFGILALQLKRLQRRAAHEVDGLAGGGVHSLGFARIKPTHVAQIHLRQNIEPLVAAHLCDVGRESEVRILLARASNVISLALLAEITGAARVAADGDETRQVTEAIFLVRHNRTDSRMDEIGAWVVAGLQLVRCSTMRAIGAGDGSNERRMMHLLGELRKNAADLHAVSGSVDGAKLTCHRPAGLGIPSIDVAHAAAAPKEDDVLGFCFLSFARAREHLGNGHAEHCGAGKPQHAAASHLVIKASVHDFDLVLGSWVYGMYRNSLLFKSAQRKSAMPASAGLPVPTTSRAKVNSAADGWRVRISIYAS